MKELDIPAINVILDQSIWHVSSEDTKPQRMKELDIPVISVMSQHSLNQMSSDNINLST